MILPIIIPTGGSGHINTHQGGLVLLITAAIFVWISFWFWIADRYFNMNAAVVLGMGLLFPMVVAGLILI